MLADLLTTEVFDGAHHASHCQPEPEWPQILAAFQALDGHRSSWMSILSGDRVLSIGGGERGYVMVAEAESQVFKGVQIDPHPPHRELWLSGVMRPCEPQHLHSQSQALVALKAFVLAGEYSPQLSWNP